MDKSILVIDTPSRCGECPICATYQESSWSPVEYWCPVTQNDATPNSMPDWCPLEPVEDCR